MKFLSLSAFGLLALSALVSSGPIAKRGTAVERDDYDSIILYGQYAGASYCDSNRITPDPLITCGAGNCPQVQSAGAKAIAKFGGLE
jgi:hypothetical protein